MPPQSTDAKCFYKEGTLADIDTPCDPSAEFSVCCGPGFTCTSNRLCQPKSGGLFFGSCTNWESSPGYGCPKPCGGDISANFCSEFTYCCQDCDCNTGTNVRFIFQNTTSLTTKDPTARIESTVATAPTAISVASSNSLTSSASSFISSSHLPSLTLSTAFATSIPSVASSSYISTSRSSVSHSSTSSPSPLPQRRADLSKTIGIGVGVGVTGLVILLIAVMVWLIRRDRRWKTELKELRARWIPPVSFLHHSSQPQPMQELDSSTTAELHADHLFDQEPHEMNANHPWGREASELSADHSVKRASHN